MPAVEAVGLVLKIGSVANWAAELFNRAAAERTRAMQEGYRDNVRHDWQLQRNRRVEERLAALEENETTREALCRLLGDEFFWLLANYEHEAFREVIAERRLMLDFASAGSINLELTISQLARVERTIRQLDPDEISGLATVARILDPPGAPIPVDDSNPKNTRGEAWDLAARARRRVVRDLGASGEILLASGCVAAVEVPFGIAVSSDGIVVTRVGDWVLKVLEDYIRVRAA